MVRPFSFEPLAYVVSTLTWTRAWLLLLAAVLISSSKSGLLTPELLTRVPFALLGLLLAYLTVVILVIQTGAPRFTFWQIVPSAVAVGSAVAFAFLGWVHLQEKQVDLTFTLIAFVFFAPLLSLFFTLVFGVMPKLVGWRW